MKTTLEILRGLLAQILVVALIPGVLALAFLLRPRTVDRGDDIAPYRLRTNLVALASHRAAAELHPPPELERVTRHVQSPATNAHSGNH